ncbi:MAG: copper resistance protein NlpE N-terminal domain-containing protein [Haliscomenobacter sp.]|nr:copper resistance protein NlpE N-terminal domain-containing protein [Haliscomenobacter sp.]MBK9491221.1 copper resistance protein NlpE N-terminal domain-containing protein [Haliscomenobacter sp.]
MESKTLLSLNADVDRTFTLEERYTDQNLNSKTSGTWTVDGDIVTLTSESGSTKYEVMEKGLVSFNTNGSKRDDATAKKYLLRKVKGE